MEYSVFLSIKSVQMYKLTIHKKVLSLSVLYMYMYLVY